MHRKENMLPEKLDLYFPFLLLAYGVFITLVLNSPLLQCLAEEKLPATVRQQMQAHRALALFCLVAGGLWSLQNIWL